VIILIKREEGDGETSIVVDCVTYQVRILTLLLELSSFKEILRSHLVSRLSFIITNKQASKKMDKSVDGRGVFLLVAPGIASVMKKKWSTA
jgi:hypothetical protein